MIGVIMRRSVLGERRDIPQTGATKIDQLFYWGNRRWSMSVTVLRTSEWK